MGLDTIQLSALLRGDTSIADVVRASLRRWGGRASARPHTGQADAEISAAAADALRRDAAVDLDRFEITTAIDRIWELVRWLNRHVTERKPWEIAKDDARRDELAVVLHTLADGLRICAVALASYLPVSAARILDALGQPDGLEWDRVAAGRLEAASGIGGAEPLFPRIEAPAAA